MGIGWGMLATESNIRNPQISLDERFGIRSSEFLQGGVFNLEDWFSGERAALFGGLEYSFPKRGLNLKLEYDTSNTDSGPLEKKRRFN